MEGGRGATAGRSEIKLGKRNEGSMADFLLANPFGFGNTVQSN